MYLRAYLFIAKFLVYLQGVIIKYSTNIIILKDILGF